LALIVITLVDNEDGSLDIQARAEPFIPSKEEQEDGAELTPAQTAAQVMVAAIASILAAGDEVEAGAEDGDTDLTEPMA
jgi:hypothetical protein